MRWRTSLRVGAVVLAVALTGTYVWFRADQARQQRAAAAAAESATVGPAGLPTTQPVALMPSSKSGIIVQPTQPKSNFSDLARNLHYTYENPYPATNPSGPGFKLSNSVSAEFAVGSDVCGGIPELMPQTPIATQPATAPSSSERSRQP